MSASEDTRTAVVVGGASGIGEASVAALSEAGWTTPVVDLKPASTQADSHQVDVWDRDAVGSLIDAIASERGAIDAIVYAAGLGRLTSLAEMEQREWDLLLAVNLTGAFSVIQAAIPHLGPSSSITAISSIDSLAPVALKTLIRGGHAANRDQISSRSCRVGGDSHIGAKLHCARRDHRSVLKPSGGNVPCTKLSAVTRFSSYGRIESTISLSPVQGA